VQRALKAEVLAVFVGRVVHGLAAAVVPADQLLGIAGETVASGLRGAPAGILVLLAALKQVFLLFGGAGGGAVEGTRLLIGCIILVLGFYAVERARLGCH
jgi:hypothetical protein